MPHPLISTHHLEDTKSLGFLAIIQSRSTNRCPTLLDTVTSVTSVTLIHVVGSGLDSSFPFSSGPCRYPNDPKWKCLAMQGHLGHISNQIQLPTFHLYLGCKRNGWVVSSISSWDRPHHFYILSSSGLLHPIFGLKQIAQNFVGVWGVESNPVHSSIWNSEAWSRMRKGSHISSDLLLCTLQKSPKSQVGSPFVLPGAQWSLVMSLVTFFLFGHGETSPPWYIDSILYP